MDTSRRSQSSSIDTAYGLFGVSERFSQAGHGPLATMRGTRTGITGPSSFGSRRRTIPFGLLGQHGTDGNVLSVCVTELPVAGETADGDALCYGVLYLRCDAENHLVWYWSELWINSSQKTQTTPVNAEKLAALIDGPLKNAQMFNALAVALAKQLGVLTNEVNQFALLTGEVSATQYLADHQKRLLARTTTKKTPTDEE